MRIPQLFLVALFPLAACGPQAEPPEAAPAEAVVFRGGVLEPPRERPSFRLKTTDGAEFDFASETAGTLTMLFFGYTNCPDVCPVHMANLAAVRKDLIPSVNQQLRVVFVTTDPERDTPEVLARFLNQIGGNIIGLTGTLEEVERAQRAANVPPAYKEGDGENYSVGHMAWVIGITPDNKTRMMYPFGTRQEDWAHDIPLLLTQFPAP
ncbi:MAG: SCO family protein [Gemmatimonadota bacterium]|nr:SCO family protein [Gemmatimonadota bacterium]